MEPNYVIWILERLGIGMCKETENCLESDWISPELAIPNSNLLKSVSIDPVLGIESPTTHLDWWYI